MRASVSYVRTRGLSVDSESGLREHLSQVPPELYDETLATELGTFVRESSGGGRAQANAWSAARRCWSRCSESGRRWSVRESQSGITGLILSLGALLGAWPLSRIQTALEATPVKHVVSWCQDNLPSSVQSPASHHPVGTEGVNKNSNDRNMHATATLAHPSSTPPCLSPYSPPKGWSSRRFLKIFLAGKTRQIGTPNWRGKSKRIRLRQKRLV